MEAELVASGRFVQIETRGSRSGQPRVVTVGFVDEAAESAVAAGPPDPHERGSILVAAGGPDTAWALNLLTDPACRVTRADGAYDALAEPLEPAEHARAIRGLILRYGTPAEGLGHGPSFRIRPAARAAATAEGPRA